MFYLFIFILFRQRISELPQPIAVKLCQWSAAGWIL